MTVAITCSALLGALVFGLGANVSRLRRSLGTGIGHPSEPTDLLHKACRAHANAAEFAPMMAVLMVIVGSREPAAWMLWTFVAATGARYLHAVGMLMATTLLVAHPLRFVGALGTYVSGGALVIAALLVA